MDLEISNTEKNINNNDFSKELNNHLETEKNVSNNVFSKELNNHLELENKVFSVDRFESDFAVCENRETGEMINIEKTLLPENIKEGSIIKCENGKFVLDNEATSKKQAEIKNMVNNLFKKK